MQEGRFMILGLMILGISTLKSRLPPVAKRKLPHPPKNGQRLASFCLSLLAYCYILTFSYSCPSYGLCQAFHGTQLCSAGGWKLFDFLGYVPKLFPS